MLFLSLKVALVTGVLWIFHMNFSMIFPFLQKSLFTLITLHLLHAMGIMSILTVRKSFDTWMQDDFPQSMDAGCDFPFTSVISFSYVLCFSLYKCFAFLIKINFTFIFFDASVNGIVLFNFLLGCSLLVYRNTVNFCVFIFV